MMKTKNYLTYSNNPMIFSREEIGDLLIDIPFSKNNKKIEFGEVSCSFDIEVTSFYRSIENNSIIKTDVPEKQKDQYEKCSCCYAYVLGINGKCIIGRSLDEAVDLFYQISEYYKLYQDKRLIFYVHNLSYEFQFLCKRFNWIKVFAVENRKVCSALTDIGIEFRCSYILTGYSLEKVGEHLLKYKVSKMVGDLDYSLLRHSETPLTDTEKGYILNDGLVVMSHIQEETERLGSITKIPLTKTGYVREYCRKMCLYNGSHKTNKDQKKYYEYMEKMRSIQITSVQEYHQLKNRAFQGGFTHCNALKSGLIINDVTSYDFTSSYPSVMVTEQYPMSSGQLIEINSFDEFKKNLNLYCCLFDITFHQLESKVMIDHPISLSKCWDVKNSQVDNGRVESADQLSITLTDVDFKIICKFYTWEYISIKNFRRYQKGYLPTDFVRSILNLYVKKTELKDVDGAEVEYMRSKEDLNSCYGMCVCDISKPDIIYDENGWREDQPDIEKMLNKYNKSKRRFLAYQWGIWVTAYARYNLFTGIYELGNDYIYADTDSIKGSNMNKHIDYINNYNKQQLIKLKKAMSYHNLPFEMVTPKTKDGEIKILGTWDFDGHYQQFKSLGAKRYMYINDKNEVKLTCSGLNKKITTPYLIKRAENEHTSVFNLFTNDLYIPKDKTGKNIHTYIDYEQSGSLTDYKSIKSNFHEYSSIHMEGADYTLSIADEYINYLKGVRVLWD